MPPVGPYLILDPPGLLRAPGCGVLWGDVQDARPSPLPRIFGTVSERESVGGTFYAATDPSVKGVVVAKIRKKALDGQNPEKNRPFLRAMPSTPPRLTASTGTGPYQL